MKLHYKLQVTVTRIAGPELHRDAGQHGRNPQLSRRTPTLFLWPECNHMGLSRLPGTCPASPQLIKVCFFAVIFI